MYRRILVAFDGSPTSQAALQHAIALARQGEGQLHVVHVVDEVTLNWDSSYGNPAPLWQKAAAAGDALLQAAVETARAAGVACDSRLVEMDQLGRRVPELIAHEAGAWGAELIIVGAHGRRGLHRLFLGSVAEGVLRVADIPVLLVRDR